MKYWKKYCILFVAVGMLLTFTTWSHISANTNTVTPYLLNDGVNVINKNVKNQSFTVEEGKAVVFVGKEDEAIVVENCTFTISGSVVPLKEIDSEYSAKLAFTKNVIFKNCTILAKEASASSAGTSAIISFLSGANVIFENTKVTGIDGNYQFMAAYHNVTTTFKESSIDVTGNKNGWVFASYPSRDETVTMNFDQTHFIATNGNVRVYAQCQNGISSATTVTNIMNRSNIVFENNIGGGFVFGKGNNKVNIKDSTVNVSNNGGNASNGAIWDVENSTLMMNGNRSGHGLSCQSFAMKNSEFESIHNGFAGVYVQSKDSSFTKCKVDVRCNGENMLSYSAGDFWLNGHTLTVKECKSKVMEGSAWLGAVGRKGSIITDQCSIVAYDLNENAIDQLKSNTTAILNPENAMIALNGDIDTHYLFLNPNMKSAYARGNTEGKVGNSNDDDLFEDVTKEVAIGKDSAAIGMLTTAQLAHHLYDWENGEIMDQASFDHYGVKRFECVDQCLSHKDWKEKYPNSFNCDGVYVYAPLVGITFDANVEDDSVKNLAKAQTEIDYNGMAVVPENPTREGYLFGGWYEDPETTKEFDFKKRLNENWTVVYAKWIKTTEISGKKTWKNVNKKDEIPPITIRLTQNGKEIDSIVLEGTTEYTFSNLPMYASDGSEYVYDVIEDPVNGFESKKDGFNFTNTKVDEVLGESKTPQTGDFNHVGFLVAMMALAGAVIVVRKRA